MNSQNSLCEICNQPKQSQKRACCSMRCYYKKYKMLLDKRFPNRHNRIKYIRAESSRKEISKHEWETIKNKSPMCPMCGMFVGCDNLTKDHIIPRSLGGSGKAHNIQAVCRRCNLYKSNKFYPTHTNSLHIRL